jgi:hypothetical protein
MALAVSSEVEHLLGRPLARGRTAELYRWRAGKVLKLFYEDWPGYVALCEARGARIARAVGVRVPAVGRVVRVGGRVGVVFKAFPGATLLRTASRHPASVFHLASLFADLHAAIHECTAPELPSARVVLESAIQRAPLLSDRERKSVVKILHALPVGDRLCHGDFHPDNVILGRRGPIIVDWADAMRGNPLCDVANTLLRLRVSAPPRDASRTWLIEFGRPWFRWVYLSKYRRHAPGISGELAHWLPVVAAARLYTGPGEEHPRLLRIVRRYWASNRAKRFAASGDGAM